MKKYVPFSSPSSRILDGIDNIISELSVMPYKASLLTKSSSVHDFKAAFEQYLRGFDNLPLITVEELVQFNEENAEKELPPGE